MLPVSLIFTSLVYKGLFLCVYFKAEYYYMKVHDSKPSFSEKLIIFFLRKGDYIILSLAKDLIHAYSIKYLK